MKLRYVKTYRTLALGLAVAGAQSVHAVTDVVNANPSSVTQTIASTSGSSTLTLADGSAYAVGDIIRFTNAGSSPFGSANNYYIVSVSGNDITVSTTPGGTALNASATQAAATTQLSQDLSAAATWTGGDVPDTNSERMDFNNTTGGVPAFIVTQDQTVYGLDFSGNGSDFVLASGADGTGLHTLTFATDDESSPKITFSSSQRVVRFGTGNGEALKVGGTQGLIFDGRDGGALTGTGLDAISTNPGKNFRLHEVDWSEFSGGIIVEDGEVSLQGAALPDQQLTVGNAKTLSNNRLAHLSMANNGATVDGLDGNELGRISGNKTLSVGNADGSGDYGGVIGRGMTATETTTNLIKNGTGTQIISGIIVGMGSVTANGGTLELNGANTYTGLTTINSGDTLKLGNATALGTSVGAADGTDLNSGGILDLNGQTTAETFVGIDGTFINSNTSTAAEISTEMVQLGNFKFDGDGDITIDNIRRTDSNQRRITKNGAGTLTLSGSLGNNRYGLTVNEGDVILAKTSGDAISRYALIMNGGTITLQGKGDQIVDNTDQAHQFNAGTLNLNGFNEQISHLSADTGAQPGTTVTNSNESTTSILSLFGGTVGGTDIFSFQGAITGNLALVKGNTNTQILTGANTYTGTTRITGGTLKAGNTSAFGTGAIILESGGTLDLNGNALGNDFSANETRGTLTNTGAAVDISATAIGNNDSFTLDGTGDMTLGNIGGSSGAAIIKNGSNTVTLSGTDDNGYLAATVNAGTLILAKDTGTVSDRAIGGGLTINTGGTVQLAGDGDQIYDPNSVVINEGTFDVNTQTETINGLQIGNGTTNGSVTGTTGILTVGGGGIDAQSGSASAILAGSAALTKTTTGTVILSGNNTYTGGTTVSAGQLQIANDGNLGATTGALTLNGGGIKNNNTDTTLDASRNVIIGASGGQMQAGWSKTLEVAGVVSGSGDLTIEGDSGTVVLSNVANTYSGQINLQDANSRLSVESLGAGATVVGDAAAIFTYTGDADFDGAQAFFGTTVIASGATVTGAGSLAGNLTLESGSKFILSAGETLTVSGDVSLFAGFGVEDIQGLSSATAVGTYVLIDGTATDFSTLSMSNFGAGNAFDLGDGISAYFQNGSLELVVVPEPGTFALLAGMLALSSVMIRRRSRA